MVNPSSFLFISLSLKHYQQPRKIDSTFGEHMHDFKWKENNALPISAESTILQGRTSSPISPDNEFEDPQSMGYLFSLSQNSSLSPSCRIIFLMIEIQKKQAPYPLWAVILLRRYVCFFTWVQERYFRDSQKMIPQSGKDHIRKWLLMLLIPLAQAAMEVKEDALIS